MSLNFFVSRKFALCLLSFAQLLGANHVQGQSNSPATSPDEEIFDPTPPGFNSSFVDNARDFLGFEWKAGWVHHLGAAVELYASRKLYQSYKAARAASLGITTEGWLRLKIKDIPELESLMDSQKKYFELLQVPTDASQTIGKLEGFRKLASEMREDLAQKGGLYSQADLDGLEKEILKVSQNPVRGAGALEKSLENARQDLKSKTDLALARLTDERKLLVDEVLQEFEANLGKLHVDDDGFKAALKTLEDERKKIIEDLKRQKSIVARGKPVKIAKLRQIESDLKSLSLKRFADSKLIEATSELSKDLSQTVLGSVRRVPPTFSQRMRKAAGDKWKTISWGNVLKVTGSMLLVYDVTDRLWTYWVLEIDPTFSPVVTSAMDAIQSNFINATREDYEKLRKKAPPVPDFDPEDGVDENGGRKPGSLKSPKPAKAAPDKANKRTSSPKGSEQK